MSRAVPQPLAVMRAPRWVAWLARGGNPGGLFVLLLVAPGLVEPWAPWATLAGGQVMLLYAALLAAGLVAAHRWARRRAGRVELFADRLLLAKDVALRTVLLPEVQSFDDRRGDVVRLRRWREERDAREVDVPTHDEEGRGGLLDALAALGVPRAEGEDAAPRPRTPPDGDTLRVTVAGRGAVLRRLAAAGVIAGAGLLLLVVVVSWGWGVWLLALVLLAPSTIARSGGRFLRTVDLHDRSLAFHFIEEKSAELTWDDVVGWRPRAGTLRLVLRPGLPRDALGEPTLAPSTPDERAEVEALLAARGVPRL
ncbi:MAG: hypothetical protein M9894_07075 [Planctomycetes bacterium]|nr:hypothetical protein [Planctomycetota bacterium]